MQTEHLTQYLETATELAHQAGRIMLEHFNNDVTVILKADNTPVTIADETINQLVIDRICAQYPSHGVIGEEGSVERPDSALQWVCDPIDGTLPYTLGIPTNVFSLAVTDGGDPIVAVVADPYLGRIYTATKGGGAFCDASPIAVSTKDTFDGAIMNVSGRSGNNAAVLGGPLYADLEEMGGHMIHHSSMVYEAVMVASGKFDAAVFTKQTPWDAAAGALLVEEAGGKVTDVRGRSQRYDRPIAGTIFSNGALHDAMERTAAPHLIG
ncbi:MAG: inositol monophosphatase [Acidimicrobiia bacterium]|nr:inositol monophosphatase [Acidimicrobiia bacterium]